MKVTWGRIGKSKFIPARTDTDGRVTEARIERKEVGLASYDPGKAVIKSVLYRWTRTEVEEELYCMVANNLGKPKKFKTLQTLVERIHDDYAHGRVNPADLRNLDFAVDRVLLLGAKMHKKNLCVGLISPDVILYGPDAQGNLLVACPDVGFIPTILSGTPDWWSERGGTKFRFMWDAASDEFPNLQHDRTAVVRMLCWIARLIKPGSAKSDSQPVSDEFPNLQHDRTAVVRMLCWIARLIKPGSAKSDSQPVSGEAPIVKRLRRIAERQEDVSLSDLRGLVAKCPLSTIFASAKRRRSRWLRGLALMLGSIVLLAVLIYGGLEVAEQDWFDPPRVSATFSENPKVPAESKLHNIAIEKFDRAPPGSSEKRPSERWEALLERCEEETKKYQQTHNVDHRRRVQWRVGPARLQEMLDTLTEWKKALTQLRRNRDTRIRPDATGDRSYIIIPEIAGIQKVDHAFQHCLLGIQGRVIIQSHGGLVEDDQAAIVREYVQLVEGYLDEQEEYVKEVEEYRDAVDLFLRDATLGPTMLQSVNSTDLDRYEVFCQDFAKDEGVKTRYTTDPTATPGTSSNEED